MVLIIMTLVDTTVHQSTSPCPLTELLVVSEGIISHAGATRRPGCRRSVRQLACNRASTLNPPPTSGGSDVEE